jgi:Holliday junction resolvase RusA-like endonuclease
VSALGLVVANHFTLTIDVIGIPAPKGSSRAMVRGGFAVNVPSGSNVGRDKLRGWNAEVIHQATQAMNGAFPTCNTAVSMDVRFRFPRPKGHFTKRGLREKAPQDHAVKPDLDKLIRSTWDAMAGIVFDDDSRISRVTASKVYCNPGDEPGATIIVSWPEVSNE